MSDQKQTYLHDIQSSKLHPSAFLWVVDLRSFDDDSVSGEVDTPSQGGSGHENLDMTISKEIFN